MATPTFGQSGQSVKDFQTQLNNQNAGVAGYTPLKVDGIYGTKTQAASQFKSSVGSSGSSNITQSAVITPSALKPVEPINVPTAKPSLSVTSYKDNADGTTTNTLSDGSTSTVKYTQGQDGSLIPTEIPNYATSQLDVLNTQKTDAQKFQDTSIYDILKGTQDLTGKSSYEQQQQDLAGVQAKEAEYRKISDQIRTRQAQTAQERAQINKSPMSFAARSGYESAVQAANDAEVGALNAQAQAVSGEYDMAIKTAQRAVDAKYKPIEENIALRKAQLEAIKPLLDADQKKQSDAQDRAIKLEERQYTESKDLRNKAIDSIVTMIKEGKVTQAVGNQALSDVLAGKKSLSDVFKMVGVTNGTNPGVVGGYDISKYATDPEHEIKVASIYKSLPELTDASTTDSTVKSLYPSSPITGTMIMNASNTFNVDPKMVFSIMAQDSSMGTRGIGAKNFNPGNIGQFDSLGSTPTGGYKSWQEGVNAVAKWLSNHKSTGVYNGEFGSTIEQISQLGNGTDKSKAEAKLTLENAVASKDYKNAYQIGINRVSDQLSTAAEKEQFNAKQRAIPAAESLKEKLKAYVAANGDTSLLRGTAENIEAKLGKVTDPALRTLATELKIAFQQYRKDMSGAAFSTAESADYESVNPTSKKDLKLNLSILDGMINSFKNTVDSTIQSKAPGLLNIRELAQYQGLKPDDAVIQLAKDKPGIKPSIDQMIAQGLASDIILEALGYKNLIQ